MAVRTAIWLAKIIFGLKKRQLLYCFKNQIFDLDKRSCYYKIQIDTSGRKEL
ncbi:hypothetical protein LV85_03386 [Algoriphagus chordae]|uniref:Uncharacterized protein n=1 Tax=Algoriphagus chordae TaxID=237019 RepID=A0A2W7QNN0_9BACT|nr:hypothetical protein LV85_03386 [Algoriphagus chordae]